MTTGLALFSIFWIVGFLFLMWIMFDDQGYIGFVDFLWLIVLPTLPAWLIIMFYGATKAAFGL